VEVFACTTFLDGITAEDKNPIEVVGRERQAYTLSSLCATSSVEGHDVAEELHLAVIALTNQAETLTEFSRNAIEETGSDGRLSKDGAAFGVEETKRGHALASHARPHTIGTDEQIGLLSGMVGEFDIEETTWCGGAVSFELHAKADMFIHAG
jgi:hypothetical protein